jgi:hypothetical protein
LSYAFDNAGTHQVSLAVSDQNCDEDTAAADVTVSQAPSERAQRGEVDIRLFYTTAEENFQPLHLQVLRGGLVAYDRAFGPRCGGECPIYPAGGYGSGHSIQLANLAGDGESEVLFDFGWGNICRRATTVLSYDRSSGSYRQPTHNWGDSSPGPLIDPKHTGRPVWKSSDGRIRYVFGCGGCVAYPIRVVA